MLQYKICYQPSNSVAAKISLLPPYSLSRSQVTNIGLSIWALRSLARLVNVDRPALSKETIPALTLPFQRLPVRMLKP
jgi:hypothetical protein